MSELELDIKTADELFDETRTQEVYDLLLKHKDLQNAEIEWRLARACRVLAEECDDADTKKRLTYEALEHAKLALDLDDKNYASHKVSNTADSMSILESLCKETTLVTINWCLFWEFWSSFFENEVTDSEVNLKQFYGYYLASLMLWNHMLLTPDLS